MIMKFLVINKIEIDIQIVYSLIIICKNLHNSKENSLLYFQFILKRRGSPNKIRKLQNIQ